MISVRHANQMSIERICAAACLKEFHPETRETKGIKETSHKVSLYSVHHIHQENMKHEMAAPHTGERGKICHSRSHKILQA